MQCYRLRLLGILLLVATLVPWLTGATASGLQLAPDTGQQPSVAPTTDHAAVVESHYRRHSDIKRHHRSIASNGRSLVQTTVLPGSNDASTISNSGPVNFFGGLPAERSFQVSWSTDVQSSPALIQLQFEVGQASPPPTASPAIAPASSSSDSPSSGATNTTADGSIVQTESASAGSSSNNSTAQELANVNSSTPASVNQSLQATAPMPVGGDQLPYVYHYMNGVTEGNPLGLPLADTPGMELSRWVMCAWSVSNSTAPALLGDGAIKHAEQLINNFTAMAPGQIQLAALANVTVAFAFTGIGLWTSAASGALIKAMAALAGGFDPALISIQLEAPDFGVPAVEFIGSKQVPVGTVAVNKLVVGTRHVGSSSSSSSSSGSSSSVKRLSRRLLHDSDTLGVLQAQQQQQQQQQRSSLSSRVLLMGAGGSEESWGPDVVGTNSSSNDWTKVWVSFSRMAPMNVSSVLGSLSGSCGVDVRDGTADLTDKPCGNTIRQLLLQTGMEVRLADYAHWLKEKPMVSLSIRLAVGITPAQAASGTDVLLATWLSEPLNIHRAITMSGVGDPIGADALIKWLITPEIWYAMVSPIPGSDILSPAAITGIALGSAALAALVAAGLVFLVLRCRRQQAAAQADKDDTLSNTSSRRRRRHMRKRRYLAPEPPQPQADLAALNTPGNSTDAQALEEPGAIAGDDVMSPDQLRPALKELGDSVTSAVRYEDEDAAEEAAMTDAADVAAAAARTSAVAAATGFESGTSLGASGGSGKFSSQRVLAARAALIAEQHWQGVAPATVYGNTSGSHAAAAAAAGVLPLNDDADATTVPDLESNRGAIGFGTEEGHTMKTATDTAIAPAEVELSVLPGFMDASRRNSVVNAVAPVTPSASTIHSVHLQMGDAVSTEVYHAHPQSSAASATPATTAAATPPAASGHGSTVAVLRPSQQFQAATAPAGTMLVAVAANSAAATEQGSPSATSASSCSLLGPVKAQPLDLAALGIAPSPLPQLKGNAKASPFVVAYNFGDLVADAVPRQLHPQQLLPIHGFDVARSISDAPQQMQWQRPDKPRCSSPGNVTNSHGSIPGSPEQPLSGWGSACSSGGSSSHSAQSIHNLSSGYPSHPSSNGPPTNNSTLTVGTPCGARSSDCW